MTLLGGAVYAGFFTLAALWLVATNPDNAEQDRANRVMAESGARRS